MKKTAKILVLFLVLTVCAAALCACSPESGLKGDNLTAYNYLNDAKWYFKDPSSVRLVSGTVTDEAFFCRISATNGFGARTSSYYIIWDDGRIWDEDDLKGYGFSIYSFASQFSGRSLDIEKINKALEKS